MGTKETVLICVRKCMLIISVYDVTILIDIKCIILHYLHISAIKTQLSVLGIVELNVGAFHFFFLDQSLMMPS